MMRCNNNIPVVGATNFGDVFLLFENENREECKSLFLSISSPLFFKF